MQCSFCKSRSSKGINEQMGINGMGQQSESQKTLKEKILAVGNFSVLKLYKESCWELYRAKVI